MVNYNKKGLLRDKKENMKKKIRLNNIENEVLAINSVINTIDECVNNNIFDLLGDEEKEVLFKTEYHHRYFNIQLVDFFSERNNENMLGYLNKVFDNPQLNPNFEINLVQEKINKLINWYNSDTAFEVHFSELSLTKTLKISRKNIVKICGNMSKHSLQHLSCVQNQLEKILLQNNVNIDGVDIRLLMNDFYSRFNYDYLLRYSSNIAKMLNDIRWYLHYYLLSVYRDSYKKDSNVPQKYSYIIPSNINEEYSKSIYWELMNKTRRKPYVKIFDVPYYFQDY